MNTSNRFKACFVAATLLALPIVTNGCSAVEDAQGAVCCTEFKAGGTVDVKIGGGAEANVAVQAVADFAGIAAAGVDDITTACRNIATGPRRRQGEADAAEAAGRRTSDKMNGVVRARRVEPIGTFKGKAGGTLSLEVTAPESARPRSARRPTARRSARARRQCDVKANPPKCTGGSLEVSCKGGCTATAGADAQVRGLLRAPSATASARQQGGIQCTGKCEGTCKAGAGAARDRRPGGRHVQGHLQGHLLGHGPGRDLHGLLQGHLQRNLQGLGGRLRQVRRQVQRGLRAPQVRGRQARGRLQGLERSAKATAMRASRRRPSARRRRSRSSSRARLTSSAAGRIQATLEANLPLIFAFKARLEGMAKLTATITGNADVIVDIKAACILQVAAAAAAAVEDVGASVSATGSIVGSVN